MLSSCSGSGKSLHWAAGQERTPPCPSLVTLRQRWAQFYFPSELCTASSSPSPVSPPTSTPRRVHIFPHLPPVPACCFGSLLLDEINPQQKLCSALSHQGDASFHPSPHYGDGDDADAPLLCASLFSSPCSPPFAPARLGTAATTGRNYSQMSAFQQAAQIPRSFIR